MDLGNLVPLSKFNIFFLLFLLRLIILIRQMLRLEIKFANSLCKRTYLLQKKWVVEVTERQMKV